MLNKLTSPQASLAGSIIGGITSGIGMIGQVKRAKKIAQFENDLAVQNMKLQNEMNQENWMAQQEYNSPARQVQRLQEAGLNPNLMYQSSPTNVATSPQESGDFYAPNVENPDVAGAFNEVGKQIGGIMTNYMQTRLTDAQINEHQARTNLSLDQLLTNAEERRNLIMKRDIDRRSSYFDNKLKEAEIARIDKQVEEITQTMSHNIERMDLERQENDRKNLELKSILERNGALTALDNQVREFREKYGHDIPKDAYSEMRSKLWNTLDPYLSGVRDFDISAFLRTWLTDKGLGFLFK